MRAINHALTGAIIGLTVQQPALAGAASVLSHYICDIIPHYSPNLPPTQILKSRSFKLALIADAIACGLLVLLLALSQPAQWLQACICAFLAAAPDFLSFERFRQVNAGQQYAPSLYSRFASGIQWFERPIGGVIELLWFVGAVALLLPLVA